MKLFKKLGRSNGFLKPLSVIINSAAPLSYLLTQSSKLVTEEIDPETVAVSINLIKGLEGAIILGLILVSILQVYKPPKSVVISLLVGGIMIFASSLFMLLGMTLVLYGLGNLVNKLTIDKLVLRNNEVIEIERKDKIHKIAGLK